ncbi:hypothetical protein G7054_g8489 [Neopestalotiopsis clavispora]|nr:hypothetical protein G7054_g8489 [Neopestalotiopsis clavispora]
MQQNQDAAEEPTSGFPSSSRGKDTVGVENNEHAQNAAIVNLESQHRSPPNNACINVKDIMVPVSASQASVPAVMASMLPQIQCANPPEAAQPQPGRERPRHQCQDCTRSYSTSTGLSQHRMSIHPLPSDPFYWCQCESKMYWKNNHLRHVLSCTLPPRILYECKCSVMTDDKDTHVQHVQTCAVDYSFRGWNEPSGRFETASGGHA